ncbi:hypothetical protein L208DRAFT_1229414 [Tricholoma matsutake]|nr:hypothetical protein L208DRAFT_1229414 [Tricholoma matsutake 945]
MALFGNNQTANTTTTPATGGSIFGNTSTQQQQPAGGGLFGGQSQGATQSTPSLFGNTNQPGQTPSLFGGTNTNTNAGGGGLFGGQQQQQQQQQQPQSTGGGLFGSGSNQQQQHQPAAGGLFGNTATQQPAAMGGGLFGNSTTQQPAATGSGLFGNSTTQPAAMGGGLFGTQQPAATGGGGGGLFGGNKPGSIFGSSLSINTNTSSTTPSAPTTTNTNPPLFGGTLGQQPQQQQAPAPGSLFSQTSQNQQQRPSLFGNLGQSTTGLGQPAGGLGGSALSTNSLLSTRGAGVPAQQQADAYAQQAKLVQGMESIYNAWNAASPQCRFQHIFYNLVDPSQVSLYRQPPNVTAEVWEKATRENPDPTRLVPVVAIGFDDLRERVEAQARQADDHKTRIKDIKARLDALTERHTLSNVSRLQRAAAQQTQLTQRLLAFIQHLHLLIPAIRSSSIRPEEEQLRGKLEEIEEDVKRGRIKGKLNELWALIGAVNAARERGGGKNAGKTGEWAVVDEDGLAQIAQILSEQQAGLAHLTKILQRDLKDLAVIMGNGAGGGGMGGEDSSSYAKDGDMLRGSTSTLRVSALR